MIPILSAAKIREADAYTILNEPIASIDLMERASLAFVRKFEEIASAALPIRVFCGVGNNGGDGLAIARILTKMGKHPEVFVVGEPGKGSEDFLKNLEALSQYAHLRFIRMDSDIPRLEGQDQVIDGLFGSGLTRPVSGIFAKVIEEINANCRLVYSIDIASGLYAETPPDGPCIRPLATISFEIPKLTFFQPELAPYVGELYLMPIGLDQDFIQSQDCDYFFTEPIDFRAILKRRSKFSHKGSAGRLTLIGGSKGKMGASILSARAALRAGVGLLTVHCPKVGNSIIQTTVPEAIVSEDDGEYFVQNLQSIPESQTVAIGPGLGTDQEILEAFARFLEYWKKPIVVDADAINLIAIQSVLLDKLPKGSILTPHPGEFQRLVGGWKDDFEKLEKLRALSKIYGINIVLKGAYSAVCTTDGKIFFNPSGNPGMATAGSGDVLTGIAGSLLAQGYLPEDALKLGVYIHGLAGDYAKEKWGETSLIASDIIDGLGPAFKNQYTQFTPR